MFYTKFWDVEVIFQCICFIVFAAKDTYLPEPNSIITYFIRWMDSISESMYLMVRGFGRYDCFPRHRLTLFLKDSCEAETILVMHMADKCARTEMISCGWTCMYFHEKKPAMHPMHYFLNFQKSNNEPFIRSAPS